MRSKALRFLLLWVSLSLLFTSQAQTVLMTANAWQEDDRLNEKVTLVYPGGPMNEMLAKLAKEYGIELSAADNTKNDLIVLMVTEQPLATLLPKIAKHFNFEWERMGEKPQYRYRLYQGAKAALDEENFRKERASLSKELADTRKRVEKLVAKMDLPRGMAYGEIEKLVKEAEAEKDEKKRALIMGRIEDYQGVFDIDSRLALTLARTFTSLDWQQVATEDGLTCSTHPWSDEKPAPPAGIALAQQAFDAAAEEVAESERSYREWMQNQPYLPPMRPLEEASEMEEESDDSEAALPEPTSEAPQERKLGGYKVRFILKKGERLSVQGAFFNQKGSRESSSNLELDYFFLSDWFKDRPDLQKRIDKLKETTSLQDRYPSKESDSKQQASLKDASQGPLLGVRITLPKEILKLLHEAQPYSYDADSEEEGENSFNAYARAANAQFKQVREHLEKNARQEPLEWSYAPLLKNIHEQAKLNVISDGFDAYAQVAMSASRKEIDAFLKAQTLADVLNALLETQTLASTLDQGWLMLRNEDYPLSRIAQSPRPLLWKWAHTLLNERSLPLDGLAEFAADMGEGIEQKNDLLTFLFTALKLSRDSSDFLNAEDYRLLRLYATFTAKQKEASSGENGLAFSAMSFSQQAQCKTLFSSLAPQVRLYSLYAPFQTIDFGKVAIKRIREEREVYSMLLNQYQVAGPYGREISEMTEKEYQKQLKAIAAQKNDPEYASYQYQFEKGRSVEETLMLLEEASVVQSLTNPAFYPDASSDKQAEEATQKPK